MHCIENSVLLQFHQSERKMPYGKCVPSFEYFRGKAITQTAG